MHAYMVYYNLYQVCSYTVVIFFSSFDIFMLYVHSKLNPL